MATHNGGWLIGTVDGPIEEGPPNALVVRLRTQVGTDANGGPRMVTIPLTIWDNTMVRVRAVARPGAMVLVTTTISAERLGGGLGWVPVVRLSGISPFGAAEPAEAMPVDTGSSSSGGNGGNGGAFAVVATPPSSPTKRAAH